MKAGIFIVIKDDIRLLVKIEGEIPYLKIATILDLNEFENGIVKKVKLTTALEELIQSKDVETYPLLPSKFIAPSSTIPTDIANSKLERAWIEHYNEYGESAAIIKIVNDTGWKISKAQAYLSDLHLK